MNNYQNIRLEGNFCKERIMLHVGYVQNFLTVWIKEVMVTSLIIQKENINTSIRHNGILTFRRLEFERDDFCRYCGGENIYALI